MESFFKGYPNNLTWDKWVAIVCCRKKINKWQKDTSHRHKIDSSRINWSHPQEAGHRYCLHTPSQNSIDIKSHIFIRFNVFKGSVQKGCFCFMVKRQGINPLNRRFPGDFSFIAFSWFRILLLFPSFEDRRYIKNKVPLLRIFFSVNKKNNFIFMHNKRNFINFFSFRNRVGKRSEKNQRFSVKESCKF